MTRRIYSSFGTKLLKSSHRSPGGGAGASHWPSALYPKHTARPLSFSSTVWRPPTAAFTYRTPDGKGGTEHCPWSSSPKATASPSERRMTVCCAIAPLARHAALRSSCDCPGFHHPENIRTFQNFRIFELQKFRFLNHDHALISSLAVDDRLSIWSV